MTSAFPARRPTLLAALLLIAAALGLSACHSVKFDPKAGAHVKTVALAGPLEPPYYIVTMYNANVGQPAVDPYVYNYAPNQPGGAVSGLITGMMLDAGDSEIDPVLTQKMVQGEGLRLGADLHAALTTSLRSAGYEVVAVDAPTEPPSDEAAAKIARAAGADALLRVTFQYAGYVDQYFVDYEPLVWVIVTLTDAKSQKDLFHQRYNYSTHTGGLDDIRFDPAATYDFKNEEALLANPALAAEGLKAAVPLIAADVAAKLKRPGL